MFDKKYFLNPTYSKGKFFCRGFYIGTGQEPKLLKSTLGEDVKAVLKTAIEDNILVELGTEYIDLRTEDQKKMSESAIKACKVSTIQVDEIEDKEYLSMVQEVVEDFYQNKERYDNELKQ